MKHVSKNEVYIASGSKVNVNLKFHRTDKNKTNHKTKQNKT